MKLAVICRPFSFHGGVETATAGILGELLRRGHAVDLISTAAQPDVPGATVRRLGVPRSPSALRLAVFALRARRAVEAAGYDVVQSHERCLRQDVYRAGEGTHRGYLEAMGRGRGGAHPYHRLVLALERRIFTLRTARHVVAISRRDAAEIRARYGTPAEAVTVVYNGVDLARFHPEHRERLRGPARQALGVSTDAWVVLFVGSGFERKGLGPLVEALGQAGGQGTRLVVAGKGDAGPYQRRAAALGVGARITWLGPRRDVDALYAMADAVALPARYEPFGNVHLEALASGLPVLTSAAAGGSEVVAHGETGYVVADAAPAAIATGLDALRGLNPARTQVATRQSAERFTYAAQVDTLTAVYRSLADEPATGGH